jgi:tetratricopeptide (TPR) repeat protein
MAKKKLILPLVASLSLLSVGCSQKVDGAIGILDGMLAWTRQDWPAAISAFLDTAGKASALGDTQLHDYAIYGLASAYLSQDEYDSAINRLSDIGKESGPEILAGVWYQSGVIAFRRGDYEGAVKYFRKSLENDPSALDAKINLELSRRVLDGDGTDRANASAGLREQPEDGGTDAIFNLVRKKEQDRWKNQEETAPSSPVADY